MEAEKPHCVQQEKYLPKLRVYPISTRYSPKNNYVFPNNHSNLKLKITQKIIQKLRVRYSNRYLHSPVPILASTLFSFTVMVYRINTIVPARPAKETICSFLHCHTAVLKAKSLFLRSVSSGQSGSAGMLFISRNPCIPLAWLLQRFLSICFG